MITINDRMYEKIADLLLRRIEETHFFNGTIEYDTDEFYSSLVCTLIVCRDQENGRILSVLPVWWDFCLFQAEGEQTTDFSWNELNRFLERKFCTSPQPDTDTGRLTLHSGKPAAAPGHARAPKPNDDGITTISIRRSELRRGDAPGGQSLRGRTLPPPSYAVFPISLAETSAGKPHRFSPSYRLSCRFDSCRSDQNPELPDTNRHAHSLRYARTAETRNRRRQNTRRPDPQSARQSAEESGPPHGRLYAKGDQDDLRIRSGRNPAHQKRNGHPEAGRTRPGGHYFRADQSRSAALAGQAGNRSRRLPGRLERLERRGPAATEPPPATGSSSIPCAFRLRNRRHCAQSHLRPQSARRAVPVHLGRLRKTRRERSPTRSQIMPRQKTFAENPVRCPSAGKPETRANRRTPM